jgi:hypothetical protein
VSAACGVLSLVIGNAYLLLGVLTGRELLRHRRTRGWSHFGAAFMVMAFTCGPHHLVHAGHLLFEGDVANGIVLAGLLLGMPPAVVFFGLRLEARLGGRGDRFIAGTPAWLFALPAALLLAYGALFAAAVGHLAHDGVPSIMLVPNLALAVSFSMVGWMTLRTQTRRRATRGGWSLSGIAMAGVFPTCGAAHLMHALSSPFDIHGFVLDVIGVPASLYFLWAVHRLYRASLRDWNRRPLIGRAGALRRPAPWLRAQADGAR